MSELRVEDRGPVRHLVIARPDKRNALTHRFYQVLTEALDAAAIASDVRCLILRGEGRAFSAGHDVHELAELNADPDRLQSVRPVWLRAVNRLEDVAKPTIACVHGPCIGAGAELALACDMRVMATDATVSLAETRLGLVPDLGGSSRLPALVGLGRARPTLAAAEVLEGAAQDMLIRTHEFHDRLGRATRDGGT
jgi:enoyl-CoA hydratase/carnithine racemase